MGYDMESDEMLEDCISGKCDVEDDHTSICKKCGKEFITKTDRWFCATCQILFDKWLPNALSLSRLEKDDNSYKKEFLGEKDD